MRGGGIRVTLTFIAFAGITYYNSCNRSDILIPQKQVVEISPPFKENKINQQNPYYISKEIALQVANNFMKQEKYFNENAINKDKNEKVLYKQNYTVHAINTISNNSNTEFSIKDIYTIYDSLNRPNLYIVNFNPTGYNIVSATAKTNPILSYSNKNNLYINQLNPAELDWLSLTIYNVINKLNKEDEATTENLSNWANLRITDSIQSKKPFNLGALQKLNNLKKTNVDDCTNGCWVPQDFYVQSLTKSTIDTQELVGPLLTTTWSQQTNYNHFCPFMNCGKNNGRALVGCVAVAVGQVFKYWFRNDTNKRIYTAKDFLGPRRGGDNYNFRDMPDNIDNYDPNNINHVQLNRFLADVGDGVHMSYGCEGSSAWNTTGLTFLETGFWSLNDFEASSILTDYSWSRTLLNLRGRRPVIMSGGQRDYLGWFLTDLLGIWGYKNGHMWVCDGYKRQTTTAYFDTYVYHDFVWLQPDFSEVTDNSSNSSAKLKNDNDYTRPPYTCEYLGNFPTSTTTNWLHMNWGWGPNPEGNNNRLEWCINDDLGSNQNAYSYRRRMMAISR